MKTSASRARDAKRGRPRLIFPTATGSDGRDRWDTAGFLLLLATVALTALPAGLATSGVASDRCLRLVELFAFLTTTFTFLSRSPSHPARPPVLALLAMTGMVLLGVAQLVPLPYRWLELAAPVNASIYHETRDALLRLGAEAPPPRISIGFPATADAVVGLLAAGALFLAASQLVRGRSRARLFALVTGLAAAAGSIRAIHATLTGAAGALSTGVADPAAARLEVALVLAFAALWAEILTGRGRTAASAEPSDRLERRILPLAGRLGAWLALAILLVATRSVGGLVGAAVAAVFLPVAAARHPRARRHSKPAAAVFALSVLLASVVGVVVALWPAGPSAARSAGTRRPAASRPVLEPLGPASSWPASIRAWRRFPVLGSGLGTFPEAFARVEEGATLDRVGAPNDLSAALVTGGVVGAGLAVLAAVSVGIFLGRAWRGQRHREESAYALAGLGALVSLGVHGLSAPVLASGAAAILLAAALGAACAAATESDAGIV